MNPALMRYLADESAVDLIEYSFLVGFLAIACFAAMGSLTSSISAMFASLTTVMDSIFP